MPRVCLLPLAVLITCARACRGMPEAPQALGPKVVAFEGGPATLRCEFLGYPPPKITWRFRGNTIDGNASRYMLMSDGALEIKPLHQMDTGIYICVGENRFGVDTQDVRLVVKDPAQGRICPEFHEEEERAYECKYGVHTSTRDGCQRWKCHENPCVEANCSSSEHCEAVMLNSTSSQGHLYFAKCVAGDVCEPFKLECSKLDKCSFGIKKITGTDGCERCKCKLSPCKTTTCAAGERCVVEKPRFVAICETMVKTGACPTGETSPYKERCRNECTDDADCRGIGKCCKRGCSRLCLLPVEQTSTYPLLITASFGPETSTTERLTEKREETMDSFETNESSTTNEGTTDVIGTTTLDPCSGFEFGCCADNVTEASGPDGQGCPCTATEFGSCRGGPVRMAIGMADDGKAEMTGELGSPLMLHCRPYGDPLRYLMLWYHGFEGNIRLYNNMVYEPRGNVLLIRNLTIDTLGRYICQANYGEGQAASRGLVVRAYMPEGLFIDNKWLVPRDKLAPTTTGTTITAKTTTTTEKATTTTTEAPRRLFTGPVDPVPLAVAITGDENSTVIGELGSPLRVRCLAYGEPPPFVIWSSGYEGPMVPFINKVYEARGNVLLIRNLTIDTLGRYTCQAYNGVGEAATWTVFVKAYMPVGFFIDNELLVPRDTLAPRRSTQPTTTETSNTTPTTKETTTSPTIETNTTTPMTTTEVLRLLFTVPVSAHVLTPFSTLNTGADLHLKCEVDGYPEPDVHWTKDGGIIQTDDRITITATSVVSRLTVTQVTVTDSGLYACHASNPYSSQSDTAQINVQQLMVPAKCTDNVFFANCALIVRNKFCRHMYFSKFCCKSCVEAGQLDPQGAELQADQPLKKK